MSRRIISWTEGTTLPITFSLIFHGALLCCSDWALFEDSTYAVASKFAGVSLDLIPGAPLAEAAMISQAPLTAPQVVAPQVVQPENLPKPVLPVPTPKVEEKKSKSEKRVVRKKVVPEENLLMRSSQKEPAPAPVHSEPVASGVSGSIVQNASEAGRIAGVTPGNGQGGGSPDVRAEPDYLRNPPPLYPKESRRQGEEGTVLLSVRISPQGEALSVEIKRSSSFPRLDEAAVDSVSKWKFKPARLAGVAIESTAEVPIRFHLR